MLDVRISKEVLDQIPPFKPLIHYEIHSKDNLLGTMNLQTPKFISMYGIKWNIYYCDGLQIYPEYRGKGLGTFFVSTIQKQLKKQPIGLLCWNERISFYERLGFKLIDKINGHNQMEWHP